MFNNTINLMLQDKLDDAKQEGRQLTLIEVAKKMSENGCTIELISLVTSLSIADIKCLLY